MERNSEMFTNECELSVIIPVYNGARYLEDTIESILQQSFHHFELIIVDDGSTDSTGNICDQYAEKDERVHVIHQENAGMSKARDVGFQNTRKDTSILFLDGDDLFEPYLFAELMKYKNHDMVFTCFANLSEQQMKEYHYEKECRSIDMISGKEMVDRLFDNSRNAGNLGVLWGILFKRDFIEQQLDDIRVNEKEFPQNYFNDVCCIPQLTLKAEKAVLLNKVYIMHRISRFTDSRLLKPNKLHYELPKANKRNLVFYKQHGCEFAYSRHIFGYYLTILKLWYQVKKHEDNLEKRKTYLALLTEYYHEDYEELKAVKCNNMNDFIIKKTIQLFHVAPILWKILVGDLKYGLLYKMNK